MREEALLLLRFWRNGNPDTWRASIEDLRTREKVRFASLIDLLSYLEAQHWRIRSRPEESGKVR